MQIIMKRILIYALFLFVTTLAMAVPVKRGTTRMVNLEGKIVKAVFVGDEHGHWFQTEDGRMITIDKDNKAKEISLERQQMIKQKRASRLERANARRAARLAPNRVGTFGDYKGKKKGIVILVNFNDKSILEAHNRDSFDDMFNKESYILNNHIGSVHDYFYDQSYGQFDLTFDVVGPVKVSKGYKYYGENESSSPDDDGTDQHPAEMVIEACKLANPNVNFADYDWDGDGEVDQVFIIYAGYGENVNNADPNTIWPHEYDLTSAKTYGDGTGALTLDNVKINTYAVSCELAGRSGTTINGIGTACHEFAHCLGYPDLYDVDYSGGMGMDAFDLLDAGSYNGPRSNGEVPCGLSAYERWMAGWITPVEIKPGMKITDMQSLNDTPEAYVMYNDANKNEYYMIENRQPDRWFEYAYDLKMQKGGLFISHVDYKSYAWSQNTVNDDPNHQRLTWISACNNKNLDAYSSASDYENQYYPYANNNSLTKTSKPANKLFNANTDGSRYMLYDLTDMKRNDDGTMAFVCQGDEEEEVPGEQPVVDGYQQFFYESFDGNNGTGGNDDKWSGQVASSAFKSDNDGWDGSKLYGANKCVRLGSGSQVGLIITPKLNIKSGTKLTFKAAAWNSSAEADVMAVKYADSNDLVTKIELPKGEWGEFEVILPTACEGTISLSTGGRFFLDEVILSYPITLGDANGDGNLSVADLSMLAASILGNVPEGFNAAAADINQDGTITVADLTMLATCILNQK